MGWLRDRGRVLSAAWGAKRYMLIPLSGTIGGFLYWAAGKLSEVGVGGLLGIPAWFFGLFVAVLIGLWWLLEYAVKLRRTIGGARVDLSRLRKEGVELRNEGMQAKNITSLSAWMASVSDWNMRVIKAIKKVNEADAEWFSVLDVVPRPRLKFTAMNADHSKAFNEHDFRLKILGEMIQNLWRE